MDIRSSSAQNIEFNSWITTHTYAYYIISSSILYVAQINIERI